MHEARLEVKCLEFGAVLEVEMLNKCTRLRREAHVEVKILKAPHCLDHFWMFDCFMMFYVAGTMDSAPPRNREIQNIFLQRRSQKGLQKLQKPRV